MQDNSLQAQYVLSFSLQAELVGICTMKEEPPQPPCSPNGAGSACQVACLQLGARLGQAVHGLLHAHQALLVRPAPATSKGFKL